MTKQETLNLLNTFPDDALIKLIEIHVDGKVYQVVR